MKRNPIYVFKDPLATGIYNVPLQSAVQINDVEDSDLPKTLQLLGKIGLSAGSTIQNLLDGDPTNFIDLNEATEIPSELEKLQGTAVPGWRILGRDPTLFATIGGNAIDFSSGGAKLQSEVSSTYGASGDYSIASGFKTKSSGYASVSMGLDTRAINKASAAFGAYNIGMASSSIFEVGCGINDDNRANALVITDAGILQAPSLSMSLIDQAGGTSLVTKEYSDATVDSKFDVAGGTITGDVIIEGSEPNTAISFTNRGLASFEKEVVFDTFIKIGRNTAQNSEIIFTDTNAAATPSIYWQNTLKDFYIQTVNETELRIWHSGNDGANSTLDAGYLGGTKWDEYATIDTVTNAVAGKYNDTGGDITGDVVIFGDERVHGLSRNGSLQVDSTAAITGNLNVQGTGYIAGNVSLGGDLFVDRISSACTFGDAVTFADEINVNGRSVISGGIIITADNDGNSGIQFQDIQGLPDVPEIFWSNADNKFMIKTREPAPNTGPFGIWHEGNLTPDSVVSSFDDLADTPASKAGHAGQLLAVATNGLDIEYVNATNQSAEWGFITGSISAQSDLFTSLSAKFDKVGGTIQGAVTIGGDVDMDNNVNIDGSAYIGGGLTVSDILGEVTFSSNIIGEGNIVADGVIETAASFKAGLSPSLNELSQVISISKIDFTEVLDPVGVKPAIYYDTSTSAFMIDDGSGTRLNIKHDGNTPTGTVQLADDNAFTGANSFSGGVVVTNLELDTERLIVRSQEINIIGDDIIGAGGLKTTVWDTDGQTAPFSVVSGNEEASPFAPLNTEAGFYFNSNTYQWEVSGVQWTPDPVNPGVNPDLLVNYSDSRVWHASNFFPSTKMDVVDAVSEGDFNIIAHPSAPGTHGVGDLNVAGDITAGGDLIISGALQNSSISATNDVEAGRDVKADRDVEAGRDLTVDENVTFNGNSSGSFVVHANDINFSNLPTTDPGVPGQLWDDNGALMISQ